MDCSELLLRAFLLPLLLLLVHGEKSVGVLMDGIDVDHIDQLAIYLFMTAAAAPTQGIHSSPLSPIYIYPKCRRKHPLSPPTAVPTASARFVAAAARFVARAARAAAGSATNALYSSG